MTPISTPTQDPNTAKKTLPTAQGVYAGINCADSIASEYKYEKELTGTILGIIGPNFCLAGIGFSGSVCGNDMAVTIPGDFQNIDPNCNDKRILFEIKPNLCMPVLNLYSVLAVCPDSPSTSSPPTTLILAVAIPLGVVTLSLAVWCVRKRGVVHI